MSNPRPVLSFRVFPGESQTRSLCGKWLWCHVFKTREEMISFCSEESPHKKDLFSDAQALVQGYSHYYLTRKGKHRLSQCIGSIYIHLEMCNVRVVAHEVTHAVFRWAQSTPWMRKFAQEMLVEDHEPGPCSESEEVLCYAVGDACAQIYNQLWKHKLIRNA